MDEIYNRSAIAEYINHLSAITTQMKGKKDESNNVYVNCKTQYSQTYTALEEKVKSAENRLEDAKNNLNQARQEYNEALSALENAEDEESKNAAQQRVAQAQEKVAKAEEEEQKTQEKYQKAKETLTNLTNLYNSNIKSLDSYFNLTENGLYSFINTSSIATRELNEYMTLMDQAQTVIREGSGGGTGGSGGSGGFGGTGGSGGTGGGSVNSASAGGAEKISGITGSSSGTGASGSETPNNAGDTAEVKFDTNYFGSTVAANIPNAIKTDTCTAKIIPTSGGDNVIEITVNSKISSFADTPDGAARAYREAKKSGDDTLIEYTNQLYNNHIAATMVENGLVRHADFGILDNETSQELHQSVADTLKAFPEIELNFVGSIQARNALLESRLEEHYTELYRQNNPSASDADIKQKVREKVDNTMKPLTPELGTIAASLFVTGTNDDVQRIKSEFNGITIEHSIGGDYQRLLDTKKEKVNNKFAPLGCDTPKATIDHELGHQIAHLTNAYNDPEMENWYNKFTSDENKPKQGDLLSTYAGTSIGEYIAEGWAEYRNNPNCRPEAKKIADRLIALYKEQKK